MEIQKFSPTYVKQNNNNNKKKTNKAEGTIN
jgi:hypothetical protein